MYHGKLLYSQFILLLLYVMLMSCERRMFAKDNFISSTIREKIHLLNDSLINGIVEGDSVALSHITSDNFQAITSINRLKSQKQSFKIPHTLQLLNDFYYSGSINMPISCVFESTNNEEYLVDFKAIHEEVFISVNTTNNDKLIVFIYGKEQERWKLDGLSIRSLKVMGKSMHEWYELAKSDYQRGNILSAFKDVCSANNLLEPTGVVSRLNCDKIHHFIQKITDSFKEKFEYYLDSIPHKPLVFNVLWERKDNIYFPEVWYKTNLPLTDTLAIQQECDQIHQSFWKLYTGKDEINKTVYYNVCRSTDQKVCNLEIIKE